MFSKKSAFLTVLFFAGLCGVATAAPRELSGSTYVNITSDTATAAKNKALDQARRQIIVDAVSPYAENTQLSAAVAAAKSSDLMNLVAASGIDGEQLSDTTYAANISMTLDTAALRTWLRDNNVQNWLQDDANANRFVVVAVLADKVADWMTLHQIARVERVDLDTQNITGNQVTFELPVGARSAFTAALRAAGWRYSDSDGVLRIWK